MSAYDAIVVGAGPAGETAVSRLHGQGLRVALVERELIGGECAYWACIPSKTLLRAVEAQAGAERVAGLERPQLEWTELARYRDYMVRGLDDEKQRDSYRSEGVDVHRGDATIVDHGVLTVGEHRLHARCIVIATGSEPAVPAIDGLDGSGFWTNREATTLEQPPDSALVLGGGPVGIELAQFLARVGAKVSLVHSHAQLIPREDAAVGELVAQMLARDGIEVLTGAHVQRVESDGRGYRATLADGRELSASKLIVATGRRPRIHGLGLAAAGVASGERGIEIDERCRAAPGVWAVGDVTGVMPFTHVAKYQARVAASDIAGRQARARYEAIPRVVFCDPEVAAVGLTAREASERRLDVASARVDLAESISRPATYEQRPRGELGLLVDAKRQVLVGAWAVAPLAGEWIHHAALAIKAEVPLSVLRDTVAQFPTFCEAFLVGVEALE